MISAIRRNMEKRDEGFTLIELLVVVIIIGILAAIAIPVFLNQRQRAFRAAVQSDLRNLAVEAETHFTDAQSYVGFAKPTTWNDSANVTTTVRAATANSYCIDGTHTGLAGTTNPTWRIMPGNQLTNAACATTP